jgi:uncharacterized protein YecE (DUF72 family)
VTENILVGSCSWTDKSLIDCGRFYPREAKSAEARLRFYASEFPIVEVDSSYYGMPTPQNARLWAERTPEGFTFNVKAFRLFTGHSAQPQALHRDLQQALGPKAPHALYLRTLPREIQDELWRRFIEALAPLREAGRLGAVHFQFSPGVMRNRDGLAHVEHCAQRMGDYLLSAEFRHRSWFDGAQGEDTLALLRRLGLVHTVVDEPQGFATSVPCVWEVTNRRLALVRMHGRNRQTWTLTRAPSSSSRFNYGYGADELSAMVPEIHHLARRAEAVHVLFNTNHEDQGQVNARLMRQLLAAAAPG